MSVELFGNLALAVGLGLLVGLQRQWAASQLAGMRTFALISMFGALCGVFFEHAGGGWVMAAGVVAVAAMFWLGNRIRMEAGDADPGVTTEFAGLLVFMVGALTMTGHAALGVVSAGALAVLLHWKQPLHQLVKRVGEDDFRAIVSLVIIGMVILPVLPNQTYGPYHVLNPFKIWLMVVLIVGISMAAYVVQRLMGAKAGTLLTGALGGLISSTATTVSFARRTRRHRDQANVAAIVIMVASTIVFGRVLVEIAIVAPELLREVGVPLAAMMGFMALVGGVAFLFSRKTLETLEQEAPPSELRAAVVFGLLYAAVLFAVAAVQENFGNPAMYAVAALSGLTDMDAITLSTAQLMKAGTLEIATGWRLILVGAMANLMFKACAVALVGSPRLLGRVAIMFGVSMLAGAGLLWLWP